MGLEPIRRIIQYSNVAMEMKSIIPTVLLDHPSISLVPEVRLEPTYLSVPVLEAGASAYSATQAYMSPWSMGSHEGVS